MGLNLVFFIWKDGREQGPFSPSAINKAIRLGSIPPATPVWSNQDPTWRSAAEMLKILSVSETVNEPKLPETPNISVSPPRNEGNSKYRMSGQKDTRQLKIGLALAGVIGLLLILVLLKPSSSGSKAGSGDTEWTEDSAQKNSNEDTNGRPSSPNPTVRFAVTIEEAEMCVLMARHQDGSGTAFIAEDAGKYYVYTNVHVASSRGLEFSDFRGKTVSVSPRGEVVGVRAGSSKEPGIDIVRFPLTSQIDYALRFASRTTIEKRPAVWTLGDSGGESILKTLPGRINGVGPSKIEVDCEFIQGNSGGPIVTSTGEVVGIASYMITNQTIFAKGTVQEIRRMAWIPGMEHYWIETSIEQLAHERELVHDSLTTSAILWTILQLQTADSGFLVPDDFSEEAEEFLSSISAHPLTDDFDTISKSLEDLKRAGQSNLKAQHQEFVRYFEKCINYQQTQLDEADLKVTSSFWQKELNMLLNEQKDTLQLFKTQSAKYRESGKVGDILLELD